MSAITNSFVSVYKNRLDELPQMLPRARVDIVRRRWTPVDSARMRLSHPATISMREA
jgi:hypothetical protein